MSLPQHFTDRRKAVLATLGRLERLSVFEKHNLEKVLSFKLNTLVNFSQKNRWWKNRFTNVDLSETSSEKLLALLPVLTREEIQTSYDQMQVEIENTHSSMYFFSSTSGSTGKPVTIRKFRPQFALNNMAVQLLGFKWHKVDQSLPFLSMRWNGDSNFAPMAGQPYIFLGKTGPYRSIKLSETSMGEVLKQVELDRSGIVNGNPTAIRALITEAKLRQSDLTSIRYFNSFAERVTPDLRELVKSSTNAKLIDRYSTEEVGIIALDCPYTEHLHVISPNNLVEIVDDDNRPCAIGQTGRVLVTNLNNYAMPLIRYELGDRASFGADCEFGIGYPVLVPEIFRIKDQIQGESGEFFNPSAAGAKSLKGSRLSDFQVFRLRDRVVLLYSAHTDLDSEEKLNISLDLQDRFRTSDAVEFIFQNDLSKLGLWKRKDFIGVDIDWNDSVNATYLERFF